MFVLQHKFECLSDDNDSTYILTNIFYHESKEFLEYLINDVKEYHLYLSGLGGLSNVSHTVIKLYEKYQTNLTIDEVTYFSDWLKEE